MHIMNVKVGMNVKVAEHTRYTSRWVGTNEERQSHVRKAFGGVVNAVYADETVVIKTPDGEYVEVDPALISLE